MMRSLFSGISGLKVHQTKMDVIGNNIANVNTVAYKSSRVTFSEFFSQSLSGASGASENSGRGGTNPMQIGLGANVASIDINMNPGMGQRTDNNFDLLIEGSGFFIVGDNSGTYFTRAGAFNTDEAGNLVTSAGLQVYGWDVDANGDPVRAGVKPIQISGDKVYSPPQTTKNINLVGNLNASQTDKEVVTTMRMFDSLGNSYTYDVKYVCAGTGTLTDGTTGTYWEMQIGSSAYLNDVKADAVTLDLSTAGTITLDPTTAPVDPIVWTSVGAIAFDNDGYVVGPDSNIGMVTGAPGSITIPTGGGGNSFFNFVIDSTTNPTDPASVFGTTANNTVNLDFSNMTQFNAVTDATSESLNGYKAGSLSELNVGKDGTIVGTYSNGETRVIFQIPVANFKNPAGLSKIGNNLFQQTINSGEFDGIGTEVTATGGSISGGMLEMSNVDLATEFTEMITTQRGFQANSRTITTSDEMLQELVNLKR